MLKRTVTVLCCLLLSCELIAASTLDALYKKVPEQTFLIAATEGTGALDEGFAETILGQIVHDQQVQAFANQIITSLKGAAQAGDDAETAAYLAFAKELLQSPTLMGVALNETDATEDPYVFMLSQTATDTARLTRLLEAVIQPALDSKTIVKQQQRGQTLYTRSEASHDSPFYMTHADGLFLAVVNDPKQTLLRRLPRAMNYTFVRTMGRLPAGQNALVLHADFTRLIDFMKQEAQTDTDAQTIMRVLQSLGLDQLQTYTAGMGFDGSEVVSSGKLALGAYEGLWKAFGPVDRTLLNTADAAAVQAFAVHVEPAVLYDSILQAVLEATPKPADGQGGPDIRAQIAAFEEQIGFTLRDDFLGSLEGSFLTYSLPAYSRPELPLGGYVLTGRLSNPQSFESCMQKLGQLITAMAAGQMQVTAQPSAGGHNVQIWAFGPMAIMQVIPSWAVQGDTVVIASHPSLAASVADRLAAGAGDGLLSRADFASLVESVPAEAVAIGIADSQAQTRQFMLLLQQFWPMMRMGLAEQGMQLPIMVPSIDAYIAQMKPSLQYTVKAADGLESHYRGTGLEASPAGVAVGAMGAAVLMPALSKPKKVAQRVVSGTNLKGIGTACVVYANDHDGRFPDSLEILVTEYDVSPKTLVSPRKPDSFDGPSYILLENMTENVPADTVLAYENPVFCDDQVNVLFVDGHAEAMDKEAFRKKLQETYQSLNRPLPEMEW